MITVKYNRGPMNGKRSVEPGHGVIRVQAPRGELRDLFFADPNTPSAELYREGTYIKSNVTLKDGTAVYEWMGWYD